MTEKSRLPLTDGEIIALARRINTHLRIAMELIDEIEESGHPGAAAMARCLEDNLFLQASAVHCISHYLSHPERYVQDGFDIKRKRRS